MVKTFKDIWPPVQQPSEHPSLLSSAITLFSLHDLYDDTDLRAINKSNALFAYDGYKSSSSEDYDSETTLYKKNASQTFRDSKWFKSACICVVNDCFTMLSVIAAAHSTDSWQQREEPLLYQTLEERYGFHTEENYGDYVLNANYTNMHKLQKDIKHVLKLLGELADEIYVFNAATSLSVYAEAHEKMKEEEIQFMAEYFKKEEYFQQLQKSLKTNKEDTLKEFQEMDKVVDEMTADLKDLMEYSNTSLKYTKMWQSSREEQNSSTLERKENTFVDVIVGMDKKIELEQVCHVDIERYYTLAKEDGLDEIQRWMDKYDQEYEEQEMRILKTKHNTQTVIEKKEKLQSLYEIREKEMEEWLEYKRIKKEQEEEEALREWAAIKIQAWWRLVMVRRKLGPFKKKKKGQKDKKKKNKSKN
ncbi:dynein regulatory complex protein 9-like [Tribolium madens]|uniref:dynein regulatory complex protein 9-like n=1 Tax=Tribolium madens TaxID=41895 RepID=UPI001CF75E18|nr:dynein regulatory complex protein 9-like [Tribolium madens]